MTTRPFYEPRILEMRLEEYANIAIDGGLWLVGAGAGAASLDER